MLFALGPANMSMKFKRAVAPSQHDIAETIAHRKRLFLQKLEVRITQHGQERIVGKMCIRDRHHRDRKLDV